MYHVQTEDKGLSSRLIVSLVYNRGTILASKRDSYEDLPADDLDEKVLAERVGRQHKLICAAVKAGRIDDLKDMSAKSAKARAKTKAKVKAKADLPEMPGTVKIPVPAEPVLITENHGSSPLAAVTTTRVSRPGTSPTHLDIGPAMPYEAFENVPVIEAVEVNEEFIIPAEAVEVVSELSGRERPADTKLSLEMLGDSKFKGGERRTVIVMVCRGTDRKVVRDAQVMIKVLGSSFRPVIFHASSDANGLANVHLQLPHFSAGRAAILIRAMSGSEEVELRRVVMPG